MEIKRKLKSQKILKAVTVGLLALTVANGTQLAYRMHESRQAENSLPAEIETLRESQGYYDYLNKYVNKAYRQYTDGKITSVELAQKLNHVKKENNNLLTDYAYSLNDINISVALADNALEDAEAYTKESAASVNFVSSGMLTFLSYLLYKRQQNKSKNSTYISDDEYTNE